MPAFDGIVTVAIPGWASDGSVFDGLEGILGRVHAPKFSPDGGADELEGIISELGAGKVRLLGWSLGALAVSELVLSRPGLVAEAVLVSARPSYPSGDIDEARRGIRRNRRGFLGSFFSSCFCPGEGDAWRSFSKNILPGYLDGGWEIGALERGLDRLASGRLDPSITRAPNVRFVHGRGDLIAPFPEMEGFLRGIPAGRFLALEGRGHMPFLDPAFAGFLVQ